MFERDYIIRIIKEMIRAILKLLFNIDAESPSLQLLQDTKTREAARDLLKQIDIGNINEAENQLYELIEDKTRENLMVGLIFYSYLNEKADDFLLFNGFSRDEIKSGVQDLIEKFGLTGLLDVF